MYRIAIAFALLAAVPQLRAAEPVCLDPAAIEKLLEGARKSWNCPGVAVVIASKEKTFFAGAVGKKSLDSNDALTADSLFPLASCTKAFTSAAIASLVDDDQMKWDDPVRKHLPTFHLNDELADKGVAIRDLLCHRTGLGPHDLLWYRAEWDLEETLRRTAKVPLSRPFRDGYLYSSLPMIAAGKAAENRYGSGWDRLVRDKLGEPLGLKSLQFTSKNAALAKDRASGHRLNTKGEVEAMAEYPLPEPNPAGSIFLTPRDCGNWLRFQLNDGELDGKRIVSAKSLSETKQPHTPIRMDPAVKIQNPETKQMSYAFGWVHYDYRGELIVAHGGLIDGFRVLMVLLPERGLGFAIFANLHQTKLNLALGNALTDQLLGLTTKDWNRYYLEAETAEKIERTAAKAKLKADRKAEEKPSFELEKAAGEYSHAAYGRCSVEFVKCALVWKYSTFRVNLEHWQGNRFRATEGLFEDEFFDFEVEQGGVVAVRFRGIEFGGR